MSVDFFKSDCICNTNKELFGLCDDSPPNKKPTYIDVQDETKWIAIVDNGNKYEVSFTAVDNCIEILDEKKRMDKRCDGFLFYNSTIIFVELKERKSKGNGWIKDAEEQLRTSIKHFEDSKQNNLTTFSVKKAHIANRLKPHFRSGQQERMDKFFHETGYILRIEKRIVLE